MKSPIWQDFLIYAKEEGIQINDESNWQAIYKAFSSGTAYGAGIAVNVLFTELKIKPERAKGEIIRVIMSVLDEGENDAAGPSPRQRGKDASGGHAG